MGVTCGAGSAYPSGASEITPSFLGVRVAMSFVFLCCVVCTIIICLFVFFFLFGHGVVSLFPIYNIYGNAVLVPMRQLSLQVANL